MTTFTNSTGISILDDGVTSQTLDVGGLSGPLVRLELTITGLTHLNPGDLDFLLVGPDGSTNLLFMSDAGGTEDANGITFTIGDRYPSVPLFQGPIAAQLQPTEYNESETPADFNLVLPFLNHAQSNGTAQFDSTFASAPLNGTWTLYIHDDSAGDAGSIVSWSLDILTPPPAAVNEYVPDDPLFIDQWYLRNFGQTGYGTGDLDLRVTYVWPDYTGAGVTIAIADNGVQYDHPDLVANYDASQHVIINGVQQDAYYLPTAQVGGTTGYNALNAHGTLMAGISAAANNGEGMVGVAFDATLVGVYFPIHSTNGGTPPSNVLLQGTQQFKNFDIVNIASGGLTFTAGTTNANWSSFYAALTSAAAEGRGGLGTVMLNSTHNDGPLTTNYDTNASQWDSHRLFVHVGGVGDDGYAVINATRSAAMLVSGFTGYFPSERLITATDITGADGVAPGDYTRGGGTTSAVSQIAGVTALMLEANPDLGWRDVQNILAQSARHTGSDIGGPLNNTTATETDTWEFNGASNWNGGGQHFSIDYGYGIVDALAAVRLAETWLYGATAQTTGNEVTASKTVTPVTTAIPDNTGGSVTLTFDVTDDVRIEDVQLRLGISHSRLAQLKIVVTSPDGTESTIFHPMSNTQNTSTLTPGWRYNSQEFRGENSVGTWTVTITDTVSGNTGNITGASALVFFGEAVPANERYVFTDEYALYAGEPGRNTIDNPAGQHTLNAAAVTTSSSIDLRAGNTSTIAGQALTIAAGTEFIAAIGGDGGDVIIGNDLGNSLYGARGNDSLTGGVGADTQAGGKGDDTFIAVAADIVAGESIDGGENTDTLRIDGGGSASLAGVTLTNVERITLTDGFGTVLTLSSEAQANLVFSAAGAADTVSIMNFDFWGQGLAPLGTTLDHLFDAGVETIIWGEGGGDNTATRDAFGFVTVTGTDGSGQLWETSELVFNAAGERQSFHVDFDDGHTFHATFANDLPVQILIDYNPGGNPVANPGGVKLITQDFDAAGRLDTHETEYFNGSTWRYHYDDGGALTHYDVDQVNPGGTYGWTINNQTFTPAGVLTSQHVVVNTGNLIDRSYAGGVITQEVVADAGAADPWTTITTDYVGGAFKQQTFVYDDGSAIAQGNAAANSITGRTGPGAGVDVLIGYGGADTFVFTAGFGTDVIVDFTDGVDKIDLTAFGVTDLASLDAVGDVFTWNGGVAIDIGSNRIQLDGFTLGNFGDQDLVS